MPQMPHPSRRQALATGLGAFALLATAGCSRREALSLLPGHGAQAFTGLSMGSSYTVKIAGPRLSDTALAAARQTVAEALDSVVQRMSHYEPGSELARLNRQPLGQALAVSAPSLQVFDVALAVGKASSGAFDVTLGRTVDRWGFGPSDRPRQVLPAAEVGVLMSQQHPGALQLDRHAGTLTRLADVQANLSGIAKGYGVDLAAHALEGMGIANYMVEVGGEIRTRGHNAQGQPWQLAIELPDAMPQRALRLVPLSGLSLATSGDYRNFFIQDGRRYSHEIDPANAAPVAHALASVSVVAADCTQADAWSTALFVLGPRQGLATAERLGLAAHFVQRLPAGGFSQNTTAAFDALGGRPLA